MTLRQINEGANTPGRHRRAMPPRLLDRTVRLPSEYD
jgi:hypothetical protein